ncbi:MAG TPA: HD-GYP domain-containing protein [Dehalococcoidia bacterium]|nr:HD-GYP domain-containing protein [Dehalococcoidia bacterium]
MLAGVTLPSRLSVLWAASLAAPLIAFMVLRLNPALDHSFGTMSMHFYVVSGTALAALGACAVIVFVTDSLRETRLVFLALAFLSIAGIFSVHGLGTPGHIHDKVYSELAVSSWFSVFVGALLIGASVLTLPETVEGWLRRNGGYVAATVTLLVGIYIGLSIVADGWTSFLPVQDRTMQLVMTAVTLGILGFSAWRYYQAFLFARLPSQAAMVSVMVLLMEVQISMTFGTYWYYSWWLYHGLYGVAFVVLFAGWAIEAKRAGSVRVLAEALSMRDAIGQLNRGHTQPIADLIDAIEWKDLYTLGHVRRVATYAVMTGKEFGLPALELRALALGAQMHDVGKIGVPDRILTKPSALTEEERALIEQHSERGYEIAAKVKALAPALDGIRLHHERVDGTGYPLGLRADDIPLQARIIAVADAFDAMTSGRVYQPAVAYEEAFAEMERCAGTHFDAKCVQAFKTAISRVKDGDRLAA